MLDFSDSKAMARALRKGLAEHRIDIPHALSLELVARQFGFTDWNMLSARLDTAGDKPKLPAGWIVAGANPDLYRIGLDPSASGIVRLVRNERTTAATGDIFATLMQSIAAADFIGHTVRIRAELRSVDAGRGTLWMRVDPVEGTGYLRFDNMHHRKSDGPLTGDVDWVERSVVLDVPEGAGSIHYGILLSGRGELLARNFAVEEVDPQRVPVTTTQLPRRPTNLGFGEAA